VSQYPLRVGLAISSEQLDALRDLARLNDRTLSQEIRHAINVRLAEKQMSPGGTLRRR
jgi:hypothetical protein